MLTFFSAWVLMPNWGGGGGVMFVLFLQNRSLVSKNKASKKKKKRTKKGRSFVAPCLAARTWNVACSTLTGDVALVLFKSIWAGFMQCCKCLKSCHWHGLRRDVSGGVLGLFPDAPSLYHYWSHICMGGPTTLSRSLCHRRCSLHPDSSFPPPHTHGADPATWQTGSTHLGSKHPNKNRGRERRKIIFTQGSTVDPAHQREAGIGWKHEEGKLLIGAQTEHMELQAQLLLPDPSQLRGLRSTFMSLSAPIPADCGKTGNWNMEGNDDWSFTETFLARQPFSQPLIISFLPALQSHQSRSVWWLCLRRDFCWCWVAPNQDWLPSSGPNVAAGPSVLPQERRGGDQEEEKGQQLI